MGHGSQGFKQLDVWKLSMRLADHIYTLTETFPNNQRYGLVQQIQRCSVSIPSNIAEGSARAGKKEFIQFLYIARGSLAELETQLMIAHARQYIALKPYEESLHMIESISRMLTRLIQSQQRPETLDARP